MLTLLDLESITDEVEGIDPVDNWEAGMTAVEYKAWDKDAMINGLCTHTIEKYTTFLLTAFVATTAMTVAIMADIKMVTIGNNT